MSTISLFITVLGLAATLLFAAGFYRGLRQSIQARSAESRKEDTYDENDRWSSAIFAVVASAVIIALVGVWPSTIYAGPILVILTAAANGIAFFLDEGSPSPSKR